MIRSFEDRIHRGQGVTHVVRNSADVELRLDDGSMHRFDHVVIASHANQALSMLADPTPQERDLLGRWSYSINDTWLHTDRSLMPRRRAAWASWNYLLPDSSVPGERVSVSYNLNRLQSLTEDAQYLVTLNPHREPATNSVIRRLRYAHPVYTRDSVATQADLPSLNGRHRTHYCGAYFANGFHEDGLNSAIAVADDLGVTF
jgi:predicted NAD/FAD-binding protein